MMAAMSAANDLQKTLDENTKPSTGKKVPVDENEDEPQSKPSTGKKVEAVDSDDDWEGREISNLSKEKNLKKLW